VYVDAGKPGSCNDLTFFLGNNAAGTTTTRQWSIKVSFANIEGLSISISKY
jgi:hypothetical protein